MLQFGGDHLALNITIAGDKGVFTPTLTGAQPAKFTLNGKAVRPVGRESDKALALLQSLDAQQRSKAVLSYQVGDLVLDPGQDGKKIPPEGLKVSGMNPKQQALLLDLIAEWAGIINGRAHLAVAATLEPYAVLSLAPNRPCNLCWRRIHRMDRRAASQHTDFGRCHREQRCPARCDGGFRPARG